MTLAVRVAGTSPTFRSSRPSNLTSATYNGRCWTSSTSQPASTTRPTSREMGGHIDHEKCGTSAASVGIGADGHAARHRYAVRSARCPGWQSARWSPPTPWTSWSPWMLRTSSTSRPTCPASSSPPWSSAGPRTRSTAVSCLKAPPRGSRTVGCTSSQVGDTGGRSMSAATTHLTLGFMLSGVPLAALTDRRRTRTRRMGPDGPCSLLSIGPSSTWTRAAGAAALRRCAFSAAALRRGRCASRSGSASRMSAISLAPRPRPPPP